MTKKNDKELNRAKVEIEAVNVALRDGAPPVSTKGGNVRNAARVASEALGADRFAFSTRVGAPGRPGKWKRRYDIEPDWSLYVAKPEAEAQPAPSIIPDRRVTALQDQVNQLTKALKDAHREANAADIIREAVGNIAETPRDIPAWLSDPVERQRGKPTPEVPITCWSDLHIGEVVEPAEVNNYNAYNMAIAEARFQRCVEGTIKLCRHHHTGVYPGVVVNLLGDNVSGGLHPELIATDEEEVIPASIKAIDWLAGGLTRFADEFGHVFVPMTAGNHGRKTAKPEFKRYYKKNFDWLIYQMLIRHFADDKRIQFCWRDSNEVFYRVYNTRYLALHGDMLGVKGGDGIIGVIGPIMRGTVKKSGQATALGLSFDKIIMGHYHQDLWLPRAIVASSPKGFDEYAKNQLGAIPARPTQPLWFEHPAHGMTAHWSVYVDDKPETAKEWVSIPFEVAK